MDFLKKHYEKILLGLVLVGLAIGAAFLPIMISIEGKALEDKSQMILITKPPPLPPPDMSRHTELLKRAEAPIRLDFSSGNKLFNPFPWAKKPDGSIIKVVEGNIGPRAVVVTNVSPLFTIIKLDSVQVSETGVRYMMGVERQASLVASQRKNKGYLAATNEKKDAFIIREVKGPPEDPTALVLELNDTGERVTVSKDQTFKREDGYTADLKYEPEKKSWNGVRVNAGGPGTAPIVINGEGYIVVAISKVEVVLSAKSNNKRTTVPNSPVPVSK